MRFFVVVFVCCRYWPFLPGSWLLPIPPCLNQLINTQKGYNENMTKSLHDFVYKIIWLFMKYEKQPFLVADKFNCFVHLFFISSESESNFHLSIVSWDQVIHLFYWYTNLSIQYRTRLIGHSCMICLYRQLCMIIFRLYHVVVILVICIKLSRCLRQLIGFQNR